MLVPPLNLIFCLLPLLLLMSSVRTEMPDELGSPPPFQHNYRFEINTSYIQRPRAIDAVPFTCSWFGFGPDRVVCTGTACSGKPLRCADVNASYILLTRAPPASCTWTLNGPCRAMPNVHAGVCVTPSAGAYESVSEVMTPQRFALAMNNCSD